MRKVKSILYIVLSYLLLILMLEVYYVDIYKLKKNDLFYKYIYLCNNNLLKSKIRYSPRRSCGLGNKLLGLISSVAIGVSYSFALKVIDWNSLWYYFQFPLQLDVKNYSYIYIYIGHFYGIKNVIENERTRKYLILKNVIEYNPKTIVMINNLAYKISSHFLKISAVIKRDIKIKNIEQIDYGVHIRTGKADGKEYLLHYLKYVDVKYIYNYVSNLQINNSIYISSDSRDVKYKYHNLSENIYFINSSICNSGYGLLKENDKCATEAIIDYYILSKCKYLILTRCSSFSLVSLFANNIGYNFKKKYKYYGNCTIHSDLFL